MSDGYRVAAGHITIAKIGEDGCIVPGTQRKVSGDSVLMPLVSSDDKVIRRFCIPKITFTFGFVSCETYHWLQYIVDVASHIWPWRN